MNTKSIILSIALIALINCQSGGNGISKSTWASSNPTECMDFNLKYTAETVVSSDSCANNKCTCATQGRVQIQLKSNAGGMPQNTFGMHAIDCEYHPYGTMTLAEAESKIQAEMGDFSKYSPWMEYNTGIWTNDLDSLIDRFESDGVKYFPTQFTYGSKTYYSVIVNACGFVNNEYISDSTSKSGFNKMEDRMVFEDYNTILSGSFVTPLKVTRATMNMDAVVTYYEAVFSGITKLLDSTSSDGTRTVVFLLPGAKVHVMFKQSPNAVYKELSVKQFEDYTNALHKEIITSYNCGFDQYADNHFAIDNHNMDLVDMASTIKSLGYPFRWFGGGRGLTNIYATDPTGFSIQLDGNPTGHPSDILSYSAACEFGNSCSSQGDCDNSFLSYKNF